MKFARLILLPALIAVSCDSDGGSGGDGTGGDKTPQNGTQDGTGTVDGNQQKGSCEQTLVADATSGGCAIRLVTPAKCQEVDLTGGQVVEFAWTTDGTYCETPYTVYLAGDNANIQTGENIASWNFSENVSNGITHNGGIVRATAADLAGVTSASGVYHWVVAGYYGSHPASVAFRMRK